MKNKLETDYNSNIVIKHFSNHIAFDREKYVLEAMYGTNCVPGIKNATNLSISMEMITGRTFAKIAEYCDYNELLSLTLRLLDALIRFERIYFSKTGKNIILCDFNPRNFIFADKNIFFIDFEDSIDGVGSNWGLLLAMIDNCKYKSIANKEKLYNRLVMYISKKYELPEKSVSKIASECIERTKEKRRFYKLTSSIDCMILAGGKSTRMNGNPKGLLKLGDYNFCQRLIHSAQCFDNIYLSANIDDYKSLEIPIVKDSFTEIGPLSAIFTALSVTDKEWVFLMPCDMPFIDENIIELTVKQSNFTADAIILTCRNIEYPTLGFYNKRILPSVIKKIDIGDYRIKNLLSELKCQYIEIPFEFKMVNINTPDDYQKAIDCYKKKSL